MRSNAIFIILSIYILLAAGCSKSKGQANQLSEQTVPVIVSTVIQKDIPVMLSSIGTVEAYSTVSIVSQVEGMLLRAYFKEGQYIKKGQLLFTIDPRPYQVALEKAQADLEKNITQARHAEAQYRRYAELIKSGVIPKEEYDQACTNLEALRATIHADEASLKMVKLQLGYCSIHSPVDGHAGALMVDPGNIIRTNEKSSLVVIKQISPIYVSFSIPEQELPVIKRYMALGGLSVEAIIPNDEKHPVKGSITFVNNEVDRTTGTIQLKGTFENKEYQLWPGQFVDIALRLTTQPDAVVVPSHAVQTGQQNPYVFVVKSDSTVEPRSVTVSRLIGEEAVIEKGLQPGERIVIDGQLRLASGTKVEAKNEFEDDL